MRFQKKTETPAQAGFTLIELMIVVAIIGIIAMVAYPSYTESIQRSKRAEVQSVLVEAAQWMERFYTENNRYDQTLAGSAVSLVGSGVVTSPRASVGAAVNYNIALSAVAARTYTLTATAVNRMKNDRCGNYQLTNTGVKSVSSSATDCWTQ